MPAVRNPPFGKPLPPSWRKPKTDDVPGVYIIGCSEDIVELVADRTDGGARPSHLRFRVFARDAMSGIGRQFEMKYEPSLACLVYGKFEKGKSRKIISMEPHEGWVEAMERFGTVPGARRDDDAVAEAAREAGG